MLWSILHPSKLDTIHLTFLVNTSQWPPKEGHVQFPRILNSNQPVCWKLCWTGRRNRTGHSNLNSGWEQTHLHVDNLGFELNHVWI